MYQEVTDKINTILMTGFTIDEILYKTPDFKTKAPKVYYDVERPDISRHPEYHRDSISPNSSCSSSSIELEEDKGGRRPRTSITLCQRDFLECEFQKERYPTLIYIDKLSRRINLPQYVIKVWFQNRRAKFRKEGHKRKPTPTVEVKNTIKATSISSINCTREVHPTFSTSSTKILRTHSSTSYDSYAPLKNLSKYGVWFRKEERCCSSAAGRNKCCCVST